MNNSNDGTAAITSDSPFPTPASGSRWRWTTAGRALAGGGALAAALSLGTVAAGAATPPGGQPSSTAQHGNGLGHHGRPTTGGRITALADGVITIQTRDKSSQTVTYSTATTFRTSAGSTTSSALAVGDFILVEGTEGTGGSVTATSIAIGTAPPGSTGQRPGRGPGGSRPTSRPTTG